MRVPKIILKSFFRGRAAGRAAIFFLLFWCLLSVPARAELVAHYKTYHPGTGEETNHFSYSIRKNLSGGYQVHWEHNESGKSTVEDYTLDANFQTIRFRVVNVDDKTDYTGERKEEAVFIRGRFKGEKIEKSMPIDGHPFYFNPKIGLKGFVLSGEDQRKFWGFQNKELKVYPMKAINEGLETISVRGENTQAVRIDWTVDDFRSVFFKRTYWFRQSDGLYLKQKTDGGKFRELVTEEGEL